MSARKTSELSTLGAGTYPAGGTPRAVLVVLLLAHAVLLLSGGLHVVLVEAAKVGVAAGPALRPLRSVWRGARASAASGRRRRGGVGGRR